MHFSKHEQHLVVITGSVELNIRLFEFLNHPKVLQRLRNRFSLFSSRHCDYFEFSDFLVGCHTLRRSQLRLVRLHFGPDCSSL